MFENSSIRTPKSNLTSEVKTQRSFYLLHVIPVYSCIKQSFQMFYLSHKNKFPVWQRKFDKNLRVLLFGYWQQTTNNRRISMIRPCKDNRDKNVSWPQTMSATTKNWWQLPNDHHQNHFYKTWGFSDLQSCETLGPWS